MKWFSKKKAPAPAKSTYQIPSDEELLERLKLFEDVDRRVKANAKLQEAMRSALREEEPAAPAKAPSMGRAGKEEMMARLHSGGLSYIAGGPADLPERAPKAHELWAEAAITGALRGDDKYSLDRFNEALTIIRQVGHKSAEARLLYNIGLAHHKLGDRKAAIATLLEGKALAQASAHELAREARKLQRLEEEMRADNPRIQVIGIPHSEQALLEKYLEALAIVYEADSQPAKAAGCRDELKQLNLEGV